MDLTIRRQGMASTEKKYSVDEINGGVRVGYHTERNSFASGVLNLTGTSLYPFVFAGCPITEVHGPNITSLIQINMGGGNQSNAHFADCTYLTVVDLPKLETVAGSMFSRCSSLSTVNFPSATTVYGDSFRDCSNLITAVFPAVTSTTNTVVRFCSKLEKVDFYAPTQVTAAAFDSDAKLDTIIIRKDDAVCTLANVNAFKNTPFASGGTGGTIYIPKALYDHLEDGTSLDYLANANWATVNGYGTITWAKIEGSQYENYYADGTPIPS